MSSIVPEEQEKSDELIGTVVDGRFAVVSQIGVGASGVVYRAEHRLLGKPVALKVLFADVSADPRAQERFKREVQALSVLQHPNIVQPLACGSLPNGRAFLVMELVDGKSLEQELCHGGIGQRKLVQIAIACCAGLQHAHEHSIVHRDVSPRNIVLVGNSDDVSAQILDFGISAVVSPDSGQSQTTTGAKGSPHYMSPEQCQQQPVDARADVYALGCVMFHALSGHPPFDAESAFELMYKHAHEPVPTFAPSSKIDKRLAEIVYQCMQKQPEKRFQTMSALKEKLEAALAHIPPDRAPGTAAQSTPRGHTKVRLSRTSYAIVLVSVILCALFMVASIDGTRAYIALALGQMQPPKQRLDFLAEQARNAVQQGHFVDAKLLAESMLREANDAKPDHKDSRQYALLYGDILNTIGQEDEAQSAWNHLWHIEGSLMMTEVHTSADRIHSAFATDQATFLRALHLRLKPRDTSLEYADQLYTVGNVLCTSLKPIQVLKLFKDDLPILARHGRTPEAIEQTCQCFNQLAESETRMARENHGAVRMKHLRRSTQFWTKSIELKSSTGQDQWWHTMHALRAVNWAGLGEQKLCDEDDRIALSHFEQQDDQTRLTHYCDVYNHATGIAPALYAKYLKKAQTLQKQMLSQKP